MFEFLCLLTIAGLLFFGLIFKLIMGRVSGSADEAMLISVAIIGLCVFFGAIFLTMMA